MIANLFADTTAVVESLRCGRMLAAGALFVAFWAWETGAPFLKQRNGRLRHAARNLTIALLNTALLSVVIGAATVSIADWADAKDLGLLRRFPDDVPLRAALALLLLDGWMYLWHRANHMVPILWRFHRMHHSDPQMDVTTVGRFHIGELLASAVLRLGLIPLLGLAYWHLLVYDVLVLAVTMLHHANISLGRWERPLSWLLVTPSLHKVHHSHKRIETDSNYSTILSLWDRLAGSYRVVPDPRAIVFGLDEFSEPSAQTVRGMLLTPFPSPPFRQPLG